MIQKGIVSADQLWRSIRREAESAVAGDPVFGASLSSAILAHPDLAGALAHQIGERLGISQPAVAKRWARVKAAILSALTVVDLS